MSLLDQIREKYKTPREVTDKTDRSPFVSSVSTQARDSENSAGACASFSSSESKDVEQGSDTADGLIDISEDSKSELPKPSKVDIDELEPTRAELEVEAGEDWDWVRGSSEALASLKYAVRTRRMRERGMAPPDYTASTICRSCGPVPIFEGTPAQIDGCPWCLNRVSGKPILRPGALQ